MLLWELVEILDSETKRRIDTARDILVGKIPDPKSQIEQITIALIYKFMDDMDKKSEELGGKAKFFTGDHKKHAWNKILDPSISGFELVALYGEAIQSMNQNPNLPQLFRDIFKNAYLPYRDPETLKSFLRIIDDFKYDHSERLGDAFEYLLSVMGSQGDAGQFRTPRNIIDFIVKVVDPSKKDTILDPACGTAGFLISAYKHILEKNTKEGKVDLNPNERKKLVENIVGYDISPDMVRLSLVNLYLHGFKDPHIFEYDTLTSDAKWDETFDVCLANPPFMTPKGGIRPHKRFSVSSNRSEVLFVDYMHEHLNNNGKAGIIVPEGIIFQSGSTYKQLRKILVENSLYAVVSLPAGVFNPYSGVKTSILLLDKEISKKSKDILFVKVENDGYNLGAQRREIKDNDLPLALEILQDYQKSVLLGEEPKLEKFEKTIAHIVSKDKIKEQDWNLSGDRYKEEVVYEGNWDLVELGNEKYFKIESGGTPSSKTEEYWNGDIKWVTLADLPSENFVTEISDTQRKITDNGLQNSSAKLLPKKTVLISSRATIGRIAITKTELATNQGFKNIIIKDFNRANEYFVAYMISRLVEQMKNIGTGGTFKEVSKSGISSLKIPLPPLEVQERIVEEIENYNNIIDGAKKVVESYKPNFKIDPKWPILKLGDLTKESVRSGAGITKKEIIKEGKYKFVNIYDLYNGYQIDYLSLPFIQIGDYEKSILKKGDLLFVRVSLKEEGAGYTSLYNDDFENVVYGDNILKFIPDKDKIVPKFLLYLLRSKKWRETIVNKSQRGNVTSINKGILLSIEVPVPQIETQKEIVGLIEKEQKLVDSNKKLIEIYENKLKDKITEVWGK
jgi:type I restriction enzyme M protein